MKCTSRPWPSSRPGLSGAAEPRGTTVRIGGAIAWRPRATAGILALAGLALGCAEGTPGRPAFVPESSAGELQPVRVGAEILIESGYRALAGSRVGLIANPTSRVGDRHLADDLALAPAVTLGALFAPEHGLRGREEAGARFAGGVDPATGVVVHSLYGERLRPSPESLADLDVLVFDIQDAGARFYTYISTLGLAMSAAAEVGIRFVVLDRPNPLGGERVEGFVLEDGQLSFVGAYPIPTVHGLTVGELARMIVGEEWVEGVAGLDLEVVPMTGWRRAMMWPDTGLEWLPTSPNVPDFETALVYPGTALFEGTVWSEGRGTEAPFRTLGGLGLDAESLLRRLARSPIPGARVSAARFVPQSLPGRASQPKHQGESLSGVAIEIIDRPDYAPVEVGVALVAAFLEESGLGPGAFEIRKSVV